MKFIRKYRSFIILLLIIAAVVVGYFIVKDTINFDETTAVYGNRLEGIESVKITKENKEAISAALRDTTKSVKIRVAGKLVNVIIETLPETALADAKNMATTVLANFSDEQKAFYDFQFLIDNSENQDQYPIIGYMQHSRDNVNWTKDREKTVE